MTSIMLKREEYLKKIEEINKLIDLEIQNYKLDLERDYNDKLAIFTAETTAKYSSEIKKYEERIAILEDIIKEEMPNPQEILETLTQKEEIKTTVEETIEPQIEEQIVEQTIEESTEQVNVEESVIEEIVTEEIKEEPVVEETESVELIKEDIVEETIETEPVVEKIDEIPCENEVKVETVENTVVDEGRPGMANIVCPPRI